MTNEDEEMACAWAEYRKAFHGLDQVGHRDVEKAQREAQEVSLTDDEDVILADWWVSATRGDYEDPELDLLGAVVEQIIEAHYGVSQYDLPAAHKAFLAGWKAAREGDQSGVQR